MHVQASAPILVLRAYRGPEDHPAMAATAAAVRADNGDRELGTVADMDNHYAHLDQAALPRDCALVELDGRVVAYGRASWGELADGGAQVECILNIEPDARGRGAEELLADHAIRRARELVADPARARRRQVDLVVYVTGRDELQQSVLAALGFRLTGHHAGLIRPDFEAIPDLPLPDGFEVRLIDPTDRAMHRRVFDAAARAFADSRGEEKPTDAKFDEFLADPLFAPEHWQVAFDGDRIAGQILNYLGPLEADGGRIGWTENISVQPEYRRRGLARTLLARSLRVVRDAGATCAGLTVDLRNPNEAVELYRSMGYQITSETFEYALGPIEPGQPDGVGEPGDGPDRATGVAS
jgi:ribosomal protein S18 acetylase RimI-like enzyme